MTAGMAGCRKGRIHTNSNSHSTRLSLIEAVNAMRVRPSLESSVRVATGRRSAPLLKSLNMISCGHQASSRPRIPARFPLCRILNDPFAHK